MGVHGVYRWSIIYKRVRNMGQAQLAIVPAGHGAAATGRAE